MPMKQQTLAMAADQTFENYRKPTRRDGFLKTMEAIVPWSVLCEVIEPHYPKAGNRRPPIGLERMLRTHFIQHWFGAPRSTKSADKACDPKMHQTRKGQRWFFGMKLHIGVDSQSGLAHSAEVTAANVHDNHAKNRNKLRIRSRVEHVFGVVKRLWGFGKVRYRGLQKNTTRAFTALALANIYLGRQRLMAQVRS